MMAAMVVLAAQAASARESGIQRTPDNARVLVSKDVGGQRYAITLNTVDGTVTGNVFSTDGSSPQFLSCAPIAPSAFTCRVADTCDPSAGRESGIQQAFASQAVLVSKDVEGQRYAITKNTDGTLTGNVFFSDLPGEQLLSAAWRAVTRRSHGGAGRRAPRRRRRAPTRSARSRTRARSSPRTPACCRSRARSNEGAGLIARASD